MRIVALAVIAALPPIVAAGCGESSKRDAPRSQGQIATIDHAVDGDTLRVFLEDGEVAYVRLVGIDTPEDVKPFSPVECGSRGASASMERLAPEGATVRLVSDSVAAAHDRFGRILAHGFVDGRQLETIQLRRGWAAVYRFRDQRFDGLPAFTAAETAARRAGRGVWGACGGNFHSSR